MKVKELIEELDKLDKEKEILFECLCTIVQRVNSVEYIEAYDAYVIE